MTINQKHYNKKWIKQINFMKISRKKKYKIIKLEQQGKSLPKYNQRWDYCERVFFKMIFQSMIFKMNNHFNNKNKHRENRNIVKD